MSIIYDALKKVERTNQFLQGKVFKPAGLKTPVVFLLYGAAVAVGLLVGNGFFVLLGSQPKQRSLPQELPKENLVVLGNQSQPTQTSGSLLTYRSQAQEDEGLVLSGVFFSNNEGYALINGQVVRQGDTLKDAIVRKITLEGVELEIGGTKINLRN